MPITFDAKLLKIDAAAMYQRGVVGLAQDRLVAEAFWEFCREALAFDIEFLADMSPVDRRFSGFRHHAQERRPHRPGLPWADPFAVGIYDHYLGPNARNSINVIYSIRDRLAELAAGPQDSNGKLAPELTSHALAPAVNAITLGLGDPLGRFRKALQTLQEEAQKGQNSFLAHAEALRALVDERRHTAERIQRNPGGQFIVYPAAGDHKPLLQVSAELNRAVSAQRTQLAGVLALNLSSSPPYRGQWAKSGADRRNILVCGSPDNHSAATQFAACLATHRVTGFSVRAASEDEVKAAFSEDRGDKFNRLLRPSVRSQAADAKKQAAKATGVLRVVLTLLRSGAPMGFDDPQAAVQEAIAFLTKKQRSAVGNALKLAMNNQTIKQGITNMQKGGAGLYWVLLYDDPSFKKPNLSRLEVWLHRATVRPALGIDPNPSKQPKIRWFRLASAETRRQHDPDPG